jgi:plasmid stabilization system protein ParE
VDFQIQITKSALTDLEQLLAYSWVNFEATAADFGDTILDHVDLLSRFPFVGKRMAARSGVRQLVHTPILIYYRVHEATHVVEILHFWHSSRQDPQF